VADIWESEQDFNNFFNSRLKPVMERLNIPIPKREIFPVHNVNAYQGTDTYRVK
jgi:heme-degrading monooxygenase HmoA